MNSFPTLRLYCSNQAHSSVEKAVKTAGLGAENLIKVGTDNTFALIPKKLEKFGIEILINTLL